MFPRASASNAGLRAAHERAQRPDQRGVRKLAVGLLDRLAPQHQYVLTFGRALLELADQPGFADARVATEQHHDRVLLGCFT